MRGLLAILFALVAMTAQAQSFTEIIDTDLEEVVDGSLEFADVDGDGDPDLMITGANSSTAPNAILYLNDGDGNFTDSESDVFDRVRSSAIKFFDADGDDDQDVLITGTNNSFARIAKLYLNDGSGTFTESEQSALGGVQDGDIAVADVDGDSDYDLLICGRSSPADVNTIATKLYVNDGDGNFTEDTLAVFENVFNGGVVFADVDGDDDADLLVTGENATDQSIAILYLNDGSGSFTEATNQAITGVRNSAVAATDLDGDNDQDFIVTGWNSTSRVDVYLNDGDGSFTAIQDLNMEPLNTGDISVGDVDNDDDMDVLLTGINISGKFTGLYLNDGSAGFTRLMSVFDSVYLSSTDMADIDGDDDNDILISGENISNDRVTKLYENELMTSSVYPPLVTTNELQVYPNPVVAQEVQVRSNAFSEGQISIDIYSLSGQLVLSREFYLTSGQLDLTLELPSLTAGTYALQVQQKKHLASTHLIVQ